jgi:hypothetical protein
MYIDEGHGAGKTRDSVGDAVLEIACPLLRVKYESRMERNSGGSLDAHMNASS